MEIPPPLPQKPKEHDSIDSRLGGGLVAVSAIFGGITFFLALPLLIYRLTVGSTGWFGLADFASAAGPPSWYVLTKASAVVFAVLGLVLSVVTLLLGQKKNRLLLVGGFLAFVGLVLASPGLGIAILVGGVVLVVAALALGIS